MDPYLGQIKLFPFAFAPSGWALCQGQQMQIQQNQALYSLLGTYYGGDGKTYFNLPDLRDRVPIHSGAIQAAVDRIAVSYGKPNGSETITLTSAQLPAHNHAVIGENALGDLTSPTAQTTCLWSIPSGSTLQQVPVNPYTTTPNVTMDPSTITNTGGGQGHNNMQPFLVLNFCIAIQGIYPTRSEI